MKKPLPFTKADGTTDELNIMNELSRMRAARLKDAKRNEMEADRLAQMEAAVLQFFRLKRKKDAK